MNMTNSTPKFGLALGGGGARGLAHIKILQILDEFGVKPSIISGTSMGALVGSLYASGKSGNEIESIARELFTKRTNLFKRLHGNRLQNLARLFDLTTPAILDAVSFFEILMQNQLPENFEELEIPFFVVTTDFYTQSEYIVSKGPLLPAIAASSCLPALLKPVELDERVLIDGGFANPVPFNIIAKQVDYTIAVDVTGEPPRTGNEVPNSADALIGASQIMLRSLTNAIIDHQKPDFLVQPNVGRYNVLDYFKMDKIFDDTESAADKLRRELDAHLSSNVQKQAEMTDS